MLRYFVTLAILKTFGFADFLQKSLHPHVFAGLKLKIFIVQARSAFEFGPLASYLHVETEQNDIAILNHIVLSVKTNKTFFSCGYVGLAVHKILIAYNLCADEASLKIRVNLAGSLWCLSSCLLYTSRCV